jgi:hypothetical protein
VNLYAALEKWGKEGKGGSFKRQRNGRSGVVFSRQIHGKTSNSSRIMDPFIKAALILKAAVRIVAGRQKKRERCGYPSL